MIETLERMDEEIRQYQAHTAKLTPVIGKLESVLRLAFQKHREQFLKEHQEHFLKLPLRFLSERHSNETIEEWVKRDQGWPDKNNLHPEALDKKERITEAFKWWEGVVYWLTNHPIYSTRHAEWGEFKPDAASRGNWKDDATREEWIDAETTRKPFTVKMRDDAFEIAHKYAEQVAEGMMKLFMYKIGSKLLPILKRNRTYFAGLQKCSFVIGGIEADVRITFMDTRSFVFHAMLKQNNSSLGKPFWQYPLTYHDVYDGTGTKPIKSMSQQNIEEMLGVQQEDRWEPTILSEKKPRWRAAKEGDIVKFNGKKMVGLILGAAPRKKNKVRVLLANLDEVVVAEHKIKTVISRIDISYELTPQTGKEFFTYTLLNQDWSVEGPQPLDKAQSKLLGKMYHKKISGNYKMEGAKIVFQALCGQKRFPVNKPATKKEAVAV